MWSLVARAELPEELRGDGLLVHDVVVARRGERLLQERRDCLFSIWNSDDCDSA